jgi:RNA-directed DNA polymerase
VVSSRTFSALDKYMWKLTYKWAIFSHSDKSGRWVTARYFGMFNKTRRDRWVFGDRASGAYLHKFAWTRIVRHQIVNGAASPDDPALTDYWAQRRRKTPPPTISATQRRLYEAQDGRCLLCQGWLLPAESQPQTPREWEQWLTTTRKTIVMVGARKDGTPDETEPRLVHAHCRDRHTTENGERTSTSARPRAIGLA